jgi:hypothetical protein
MNQVSLKWNTAEVRIAVIMRTTTSKIRAKRAGLGVNRSKKRKLTKKPRQNR